MSEYGNWEDSPPIVLFCWLETKAERSRPTGQSPAVMDAFGWPGIGEGFIWLLLALQED